MLTCCLSLSKILLSFSQSADLLFNYSNSEYIRKKPNNATSVLDIFTYALNIEDLSVQCAFKIYALKNVDLETDLNDERLMYSFNIVESQLPPNFKEMSLSLVTIDKFLSDDQINHKDECTFVKILSYRHRKLHFELKRSKTDKTPTLRIDTKYYIRFIPNRIAFRSCLQSLDAIKAFELSEYFEHFEVEPANVGRKNGDKIEKFECFNKMVEKNVEQMTAVRNIVNCTAYPFPFCVFGPPGKLLNERSSFITQNSFAYQELARQVASSSASHKF